MNSILQEALTAMSRYLHPVKAQLLIEGYCSEKYQTSDVFVEDDVGNLVLYMTTKRDELASVDDKAFLKMLNDLIHLYNSFVKRGGAVS